jgi:hypothetical protein
MAFKLVVEVLEIWRAIGKKMVLSGILTNSESISRFTPNEFYSSIAYIDSLILIVDQFG